jgi:hypothetical protein
MGCPFVIPPHPVCGRGTKPRGRLRVGLSPHTRRGATYFLLRTPARPRLARRRRRTRAHLRLPGRQLTFAYPVAKRDWAEERRFEEGLARLKRWVV